MLSWSGGWLGVLPDAFASRSHEPQQSFDAESCGGNVQVGSWSGTLDEKTIERVHRVVESHFSELAACYARAPWPYRPQVTLNFEIMEDGTVADVDAPAPSFWSRHPPILELRDCLMHAVSGWRFERDEPKTASVCSVGLTGQTARVTLPFQCFPTATEVGRLR